ncbi:unnamed protein product, partial [Didymodactylos carnosus]
KGDTSGGSNLNELSGPNGCYIDPSNGNIYVADNGNSRALRFPSGSTNTTNGTIVAGGNGSGPNANQLSNPRGVVVDQSGNVFVTDNS